MESVIIYSFYATSIYIHLCNIHSRIHSRIHNYYTQKNHDITQQLLCIVPDILDVDPVDRS